CQLSYGMPFTF
nr:immunoglobulin light chain junction region [Macaca mulatta]